MQAVVLAAGLGTRLRPITDDRSKAMVPVLGRPLVDLAVEAFLGAGIREFVVVVGPEDEAIQRHFRDHAVADLEPRFVVQEERLGMAHALAAAAPAIDGDFVLTACDSVVPAGFVRRMVRRHRPGTTVLGLMDVPAEKVGRSAAVALDGEMVRQIVEKPGPGEAPSNTVSLPHYILAHRIVDLLGGIEPSLRGEIELQSAIQRLIEDGERVVGVRTAERTQVSSPEDLLALNLEHLRQGRCESPIDRGEIGRGTVTNEPLRLEKGAAVGRDCVIGPVVYIEAGAVIGDRVEIRESVVLRGAVVPDDTRVQGEILG
jgi:NDP-sugar pyrophosphorylase family protein